MTSLTENIFLKVSLDAARKSLAASGQPGRQDGSLSPCRYDSEDTMSMGAQTPGGNMPIKFSNTGRDVAGREINGGLDVVYHLVNEFEHQKQDFDNEAKSIIQVKSGRPEEELQKLKLKFVIWKRDYKSRLREIKTKLHKIGHSEPEKSRRNWWGKKIRRGGL